MKRVLFFAILTILGSNKSYSQCIPNCPGNVNVSLIPNDCKVTLSAADFVKINPSCTYKLELEYPYGTKTYNPPVQLDASHQGYSFNYVIRDSATNNPCWGKVTVNYCNPCSIPTPPVIDSFVVSPGPYIPGTTISLKMYAIDNISIQKVEFYHWYGDPIYTDNTFPYSYDYTLPAATATENKFWAIVYDNCGSTATSIELSVNTLFPACNDNVKNGSETGIDCGGSSCNACYNPGPIYPLPDLMLKNISSIPNNVTSGQWLQLNGKVYNKGNASAAGTIVKAALSTDANLSNNDYALGTTPIPSLAVNDSTPYGLNVAMPNWSTGSYYLVICVDPHYDITETTDLNNCVSYLLHFEKAPSYEPDLITSYLDINKNPINQGDVFKVSYMVNNISNVHAGYSYSAVYLSYDSYFDGGDIKLDEFSISSINANSNIILESNVNKSIAPGNYYIIVCADSKNHLSETSETNNCSSIFFKVQGLNSYWPDYTTSFLSASKNPIASEEPFTVSFMINNKGNTSGSACSIGMYLSEDNEWNSTDRMLTQMKFPAIPADKSIFTEAGIYESFTPGKYHLIVCADINSEVKEESELNNCFSMAITITEKAAPKPDLVIETFTTKSTWNIGDTQNIKLRIRNIGYANNGAGHANLLLSDDINGTNAISLGQLHFPAMNTNGFYDTTIFIIITDRSWEGQKHISTCIDPSALIPEANESNNCKSVALNIVLPAIDFKNITAISFPNAINKNDTLRFPFKMTNIGTLIGKKVEVEYYLSFKAGLKGGSAIRVKIDTIDTPLPVGDTLNKKVNLTFPASASGGYYLNICIDYNNKVAEKSEINNCQAMRIYLTAPIAAIKAESTGFNKVEQRGSTSLNDISIFPNPTTERINIKGFENTEGIKDMKIMDLNGRLISQSKNISNTVTISNLPKGVYILRLSNNTDSKVFRMVKE